jgi:N-acetylglucosamine-6-phosphate deacetylase
MAGVPLAVAWNMASHNPARLLGCEPVRLARADLTVFDYAGPDSDLTVRATLADGCVRFGAIPPQWDHGPGESRRDAC